MLKKGIAIEISLGHRMGLVTFGLFTLLFLTAVACGSAAESPSETAPEVASEAVPGTIHVRFDQGKMIPDTIQVTHGDTVKIMIESTESGQLHFHGYNIEVDVAPGALAEVSVNARVTGTFKITLHAIEEAHEHGPGNETDHETDHEPETQLGTLVVVPR